MSCAERMIGLTLDGGWLVTERVSKSSTGGSFSVGYRAAHPDGRKVFVKAMDYTRAFMAVRSAGMPMSDIMKKISGEYVFERDFSRRCKDLSLKRIAHAIESGSCEVDPTDILGRVDYLLFDLADGDVRAHLEAQVEFDAVFALRSLHQIASALFHLHSADMAHQDLKPSNSLLFGDAGTKVCDFGRSWSKDIKSPCDDYPVAGDSGYTPFELRFNAVPTSHDARRFGCDMYQLGSMIVFFFAKATINGLINAHLVKGTRPISWGGSFATFLPYLKAAFGEALDDFANQIPHELECFRSDLVTTVGQLCEPDPARRGHPADRAGQQYSLERYVSKLNLLAFKAETRIKNKIF